VLPDSRKSYPSLTRKADTAGDCRLSAVAWEAAACRFRLLWGIPLLENQRHGLDAFFSGASVPSRGLL